MAIEVMKDLKAEYVPESPEPFLSGEYMIGGPFHRFIISKTRSMDGVLSGVRSILIDNYMTLYDIIRFKCICLGDTAYERVDKYTDRGFQEIPFNVHLNRTKGWLHDNKVRIRKMGDSESTVVPFYGYNSLYSDRVVKQDMERILEFTWFEYNAGTMPRVYQHIVEGILDISF
jgi:hypothetical protein